MLVENLSIYMKLTWNFLGYLRIFNTGSPINMTAGNSSGDLRPVIAHYQRRQATMEENRQARMKDGKVQSLYDDDRYF